MWREVVGQTALFVLDAPAGRIGSRLGGMFMNALSAAIKLPLRPERSCTARTFRFENGFGQHTWWPRIPPALVAPNSNGRWGAATRRLGICCIGFVAAWLMKVVLLCMGAWKPMRSLLGDLSEGEQAVESPRMKKARWSLVLWR